MAEERLVGEEARKMLQAKLENGFIATYLSGPRILDIGYKGYVDDVVPIVPQAIGVELDYPGYDGRTLPFADGSQDAVFASHCLEHIPDFAQSLRDWFRVLRVGGYMVVMVPHQFLYEKRTSLPSHFNADHRRFYTPAALMADIEATLPPNHYRLRHLADNDAGFDYSIVPEQHSGGSYEIEMVIEKIATPDWILTTPQTVSKQRDDGFDAFADADTDMIVRGRDSGAQRITVLPGTPHHLALYDFGHVQPARRRILAMQLGHLGDFIIGLPALRKLRESFADDRITLVVGSWNRGVAEQCGLADEVVTHDHFPEVARAWDGKPVEEAESFARKLPGHFDIAIDMRVDEDTRHLLEHVAAETRCGIGIGRRFPFLDVLLPFDQTERSTDNMERSVNVLLGPERFHSRMPTKTIFRHETDFRKSNDFVIFGPYLKLPAGRYRATFGLHAQAFRLLRRRVVVTLDVVQGVSNTLAKQAFSLEEIGEKVSDHIHLDFTNLDPDTTCEFRVHIGGRPLRGKLAFIGVQISQLEGPAGPRFRRADLHIGEQLSLLVQLLADRTLSLYPRPEPSEPPALPPELHIPKARYRFVIAPVSNSDLRDWPVAHYVSLVQKLVAQFDCTVLLIGSRPQSGTLGHIVQASGVGGHRIVNLAGRTAWPDIPALLRSADLVICNNSGIAHLAASVGTRTLALYSASHQPQEWGPRGVQSRALMAVVPCSPCGHDRLADCPYEHACMQGLAPDSVLAQAVEWLGGS